MALKYRGDAQRIAAGHASGFDEERFESLTVLRPRTELGESTLDLRAAAGHDHGHYAQASFMIGRLNGLRRDRQQLPGVFYFVVDHRQHFHERGFIHAQMGPHGGIQLWFITLSAGANLF